MNTQTTAIDGLIIIEPRIFSDDRGEFTETFQRDRYRALGITNDFVQDNLSVSKKGTLRGLHYQAPPRSQGKLVQVIKGRALDVAVDIRFGSPTFGKYVAVELSGETRRQFWIPEGFAHGFLALEDGTIFSYKCTDIYSPEHDRGILWSDPEIGIAWPTLDSELAISSKDATQPLLREIVREFVYA